MSTGPRIPDTDGVSGTFDALRKQPAPEMNSTPPRAIHREFITIAAASGAHDRCTELREWVDFEFEALWGDLRDAYLRYLQVTPHRHKHFLDPDSNCAWSMHCDSLGDRIVTLTRLLGPISWRRIGIEALTEGWFAYANTKLGIPDPDMPTAAELAALIAADERVYPPTT
ncbi:hypothetical protein [Mycolicibacterium sphagni]|uniref:hypothetical protein n=1 Tax=Mycolicibacterium sphagni TaxID=1786 RepID=UPI0021F398FD|nr:hypothetical protein [Mycolicibacterium sphagni]MCV7175706.1 hypothetical protein [Mycolicibacterium sphagni]